MDSATESATSGAAESIARGGEEPRRSEHSSSDSAQREGRVSERQATQRQWAASVARLSAPRSSLLPSAHCTAAQRSSVPCAMPHTLSATIKGIGHPRRAHAGQLVSSDQTTMRGPYNRKYNRQCQNMEKHHRRCSGVGRKCFKQCNRAVSLLCLYHPMCTCLAAFVLPFLSLHLTSRILQPTMSSLDAQLPPPITMWS